MAIGTRVRRAMPDAHFRTVIQAALGLVGRGWRSGPSADAAYEIQEKEGRGEEEEGEERKGEKQAREGNVRRIPSPNPTLPVWGRGGEEEGGEVEGGGGEGEGGEGREGGRGGEAG